MNIDKIPTAEELKEQIWQRYGSFELSHEKNVGIVENILEFVLKNRVEFAKLHVKVALEAAAKKAKLSYRLPEDFEGEKAGFKFVATKDSILNAYPEENIK